MQGLTESPVVKTTPSKVEDESLILVRQLRALMLPPPKQNTQQKQHCNKLNKDFRNGIHQNPFKKYSANVK